MEPNQTPRERFVRFVGEHALWDFCKWLIALAGAWIVSHAGARMMHAALGTTLNLFLLIVGLMMMAWGTGFLPRKKPSHYLKSALLARCDEVVLGWKSLAEEYQNAPKKEGELPTLPNPMDPSWRGYGLKDWLYSVGQMQAYTHNLIQDLRGANIAVGEINYQRTSMATLLELLERYRREVASMRN